MNGTVHLKEPMACSEAERREFARLVRLGFNGSDERLPGRIRSANLLAFFHARDATLAAIAALKAPTDRHRHDLFERAAAGVDPAEYRLDLGWVFVEPRHRRHRVASHLCRLLMERAPHSPVFATTRPDNAGMITILLALGFARVGKPFPRRNEELVLFLRPGQRQGPARTAERRRK